LPTIGWKEDTGIDLGEIGWGVVDWIDLVQGRDKWRAFVNTVTYLRFPQNVGKFVVWLNDWRLL
jgi:hypothetical protein